MAHVSKHLSFVSLAYPGPFNENSHYRCFPFLSTSHSSSLCNVISKESKEEEGGGKKKGLIEEYRSFIASNAKEKQTLQNFARMQTKAFQTRFLRAAAILAHSASRLRAPTMPRAVIVGYASE